MTNKIIRRGRRSFGGKDGIWWRKKTQASSHRSSASVIVKNDDSDDGQQKQERKNKKKTSTHRRNSTGSRHSISTIDDGIIGWDPILCRPIYNHNSSSASAGDDDDDDDDDDASDTSFNNGESSIVLKALLDTNTPSSTKSPLIKDFKPIPVSRSSKRNYGSRKRPSCNLFIDNDIDDGKEIDLQHEGPSHKKKIHLDPSHTESADKEADEENPISTPFACNEKIRRQVSDHNIIGSRCNHTMATKEDENDTDSSSPVVDTLSFDDDNKQQQKKENYQQPNSSTSLLEARSFFEHLDSTHQLTVDSSSTPNVPSKVTRTRRHLRIDSPGLADEYSAYAKSSTESGVTPLSVKEYARNRSTFFRKSDIFNGFLDE